LQGLFGYLDEDAEDDGNEASDTQTGLSQALERLPLDRRCLVFLISDFQNLSSSDQEMLEVVGNFHDTIALVVGDPRERDLPDGTGFRDLEDLGSGGVSGVFLSDKNRRQWRDKFNRQRLDLRKRLVDLGISMQEFWTDEDEFALNEKILPIYAGNRPMENES
jgi:hypothetical protein